MTRVANVFTDPATGTTYAWPVNHSSEASVAKSRQMADGAPTSDIGLIPQQGAPTPLIFSWEGTIFTKAQLVAMLGWWQLCDLHSIYLTDPSGSEYEIIITDFSPQKIRVAQNRHDMTNAPTWQWKYTMVFRVLRAISGEWVGVTP